MIGPAAQTRVVPAAHGPTYRVANEIVTFKALAADTNGAYSLFETATAPGAGIPRHRQWYDDEAFWVLDGCYTFLLDEREVTLGAGGYAYVPRGRFHAYTNRGSTPGRLLILLTPGGIHERFFTDVGEHIVDGSVPVPVRSPLDLSRLVHVAHTYGIEIAAPATEMTGA